MASKKYARSPVNAVLSQTCPRPVPGFLGHFLGRSGTAVWDARPESVQDDCCVLAHLWLARWRCSQALVGCWLLRLGSRRAMLPGLPPNSPRGGGSTPGSRGGRNQRSTGANRQKNEGGTVKKSIKKIYIYISYYFFSIFCLVF